MTGFRITVLLQNSSGCAFDKKKCLIFLEEKWAKVADLEAHLKKGLGVKRLEVFIDDCWVSSEEPICIIKPSDTVTVRLVEILSTSSLDASTNVAHEEDVIQEKKEKRVKKKKVERSPVRTADEPEVADDADLATKKAELLMKVEAALGMEQMDVTDNPSLTPPAKKRRHRKRPSKKRKEFLERLSVGATLLSYVTEQTNNERHQDSASEEISARPASSHHIRFDEETVRCNNDNTIVDTDTPKEDWHERLLFLARECNKPVFVRTEIPIPDPILIPSLDPDPIGLKTSDPTPHQNGVTNGLNGNDKMNGDEKGICDRLEGCHTSYLHNSVPTDTAKAGDLLFFKKLTVKDGQPQISDHLLAVVEEVNDSGNIVLKIVEGRPEQAFTPDEIQDSEDGCFVINVHWRNIIEPRLIVDASVLSKYL